MKHSRAKGLNKGWKWRYYAKKQWGVLWRWKLIPYAKNPYNSSETLKGFSILTHAERLAATLNKIIEILCKEKEK